MRVPGHEGVEPGQARFRRDIAEIQYCVSLAVDPEADQARVFAMPGCWVDRVHVSTQLDVLQHGVRIKEVPHVQQGDLADHCWPPLSVQAMAPFRMPVSGR